MRRSQRTGRRRPARAGLGATVAWLLARLTGRSRLPLALERRRPASAPLPFLPAHGDRPEILALGIYLGDRLNTADDVTRRLAECRRGRVEQDWTAVGRPSSDPVLARRTRDFTSELRPKYELLSRALARHDLSRFDFLIVADDDILLPYGFLDDFLGLQIRFDLAIAQPARTSESYIDLPIVERHPGLLARATRFVEQGPVISFRRDSLDLVLPFDLTSPMGWGLENVWSLRTDERGLRMGIVDATPVDHSLRRPVALYDWAEADLGRRRLFETQRHRPTDDCFRVLDAYPLEG